MFLFYFLYSYYASTTENLWCWGHSVLGASICGWVCESWKTCKHHIKKTINEWSEFHPILVSYAFVFIDVLIRFWGQWWNIKVTPSNDPKTFEHHISKTNEGNFAQFWSQVHCSSWMSRLDVGFKRSKVKVTEGRWKLVDEYNIFLTTEAKFTKIGSQLLRIKPV